MHAHIICRERIYSRSQSSRSRWHEGWGCTCTWISPVKHENLVFVSSALWSLTIRATNTRLNAVCVGTLLTLRLTQPRLIDGNHSVSCSCRLACVTRVQYYVVYSTYITSLVTRTLLLFVRRHGKWASLSDFIFAPLSR